MGANNNPTPLLKMKYIFSQEQLVIPDNVKIHIRSRIVSVEGPRGKLTKDLSHIAVTFSLPPAKKGQQIVQIEIHHGSRKNVATLRTVKSIIQTWLLVSQKASDTRCDMSMLTFPSTSTLRRTRRVWLTLRSETSWARRSFDMSRCAKASQSRHPKVSRIKLS